MGTDHYTYLRQIRFNNILFWDIKRYQNVSVKSRYPLEVLSNLIVEENTKYDISNPLQEYGILGVNNKTGIFDAYLEKGADIKQKYKRMETGWIAYNPYRINVGSVGIKHDYDKYEYISPAYVVFRCGPRLLPEFLYLVLKTKKYNEIIKQSTTGSVRQTLTYNSLVQLPIPLPSLSEQKAIVAAYNKSLTLADQYEQQAKQEEKSIHQYLYTFLGMMQNSSENGENHPVLHFAHLLELAERWDIWNLAKINYTGGFPLVALSHIISMSSGKFLPSKSQVPGKYIVYGGNGQTGTHNKFCFSGKRIVIGRVGEYCGNVHLVDGEYWITDNALKVDLIKDDVLWEYLKIALHTLNINQYRSISAQPSISQKKILQLQIPLPSLSIQKEIVDFISEFDKKRNRLLSEAEQSRHQALQQFEQTIFE